VGPTGGLGEERCAVYTRTRLSEAFDGFFRGAFDASVPVTRTTDSAGTSRMEGTLSVAVEVGGVEEES
jgi:hypothetical protein